MYKAVLFDLDGTITDPGLGITNSVMYALEKYHIKVDDRSALYKFIGPPLKESFEKYYHFSDEESTCAIAYYREYFREKGIYENVLYDGMEELLKHIRKSGQKLILATSKPEEFAIQILKYFEIEKYFDFVAGATMEETRVQKAEVITYALTSCGIADLSSVIMVGDREHDIYGAKEVGIDSIGVLYGYGSREELQSAGATYIVESVGEIGDILNE